MKCIIVNDDFSMKRSIEKLIIQTDNMQLVSTFNSILEASFFLKNNKIDIVFFDIEMNDVNCIELLQIIPKNTFVIYIPEFSPFVNRNSRFNSEKHLESQIPKRFGSVSQDISTLMKTTQIARMHK